MIWRLISIILGFTLLLAVNGVAKERDTYAISLSVFKYVEQANLLVEEGQIDEAIEVIKNALEKRSTRYEKAQLYTLMGSIYYRQSDEASALTTFVKVLEFEQGIPLLMHQQTLKTLSQLSMIKEDYLAAKQYCEKLIAISEEKNQLDYALLAQANYKLEEWDSALNAALLGVDTANQQGKTPDENLLLLLNAVHYEKKAMPHMVGVLELLIKYYPKKTYILYLASVYGQLDQLDKQTVLMESLYDAGKITEGSQLRNLASLYMSEKVPYKGALVLEKAISQGVLEENARNYEMLSQAWRLAAQRAESIVAIGKAAELSKDGNNYLKKAYLHFDSADWPNAEKSVYLALDKGLKESSQGEAWLLLGMSRFNMKHFNKAIESCENAKKFPKSAKLAKQWISYISTEKDKYEALKSAM